MSENDHFLNFVEIDKYTVKKLSFGNFTKIVPHLMTLKNALVNSATKDLAHMTQYDVMLLLAENVSLYTPIVAKCVGVSEEEINELPGDVGVKLAFAVWDLNSETFLNFFALGSQMVTKALG